MINKLVTLFLILLCMASCGKNYVYRIEGKLSNLEDQTIYVVFEREDYRVVDTVVCEKPGQFVIDQMHEGFNSANLFLENRTELITLYLEPNTKISISGDARYPLLLNIKNGRINEQLVAMRKSMSGLLKEYTDLKRQLSQSDNSIEETEIAAQVSNIYIQIIENVVEYIKDNPDKEASVILIERYFAEPDDTRKMDELLALLSPELKAFYLMRELEQYSSRSKRTAIGAEAPGFDVRNIYGQPVSLDNYKDHYLLLAFTAPWCDMCQTEDLFLDKVASNYPKDKVDILLISLDNNPQEVRNVLVKDSIEWNLVTDSAGQASMLFDLYNVSALPRCFLIDEERTILMKTDNGLEIEQTLEKLFTE